MFGDEEYPIDMFDCADACHEEDYPLREGEGGGEKCAAAGRLAGHVGVLLFRDRYDEAERVQPIGGGE